MQQVKVLPEELLIQLGSYPRGATGDQRVEASGTEAHVGGSANVRAATRV